LSTDFQLSVPLYREKPPRELSAAEAASVVAVADVLIGPSGDPGSPGRLPDFRTWLDRALAARRDAFEDFVGACVRLAEAEVGPDRAARELAESDPMLFHLVSTTIAGAYLMVPAVREAIGYPGQERKHPRFDEAAEEIMDGILDPVIERGPVYRDVSHLS